MPPRPMQSRREDRQFGWSQTSPMPQGTTCSSVETEQTRYSSRRVSGRPQFLMMLICNWDQIFEPCSEQILFHSCPPSRAERGLPHPNLNIYHVRYVDSNMQAENRRQFPTTNCTSHVESCPSQNYSPQNPLGSVSNQLLFPNQDHLYAFPQEFIYFSHLLIPRLWRCEFMLTVTGDNNNNR